MQEIIYLARETVQIYFARIGWHIPMYRSTVKNVILRELALIAKYGK